MIRTCLLFSLLLIPPASTFQPINQIAAEIPQMIAVQPESISNLAIATTLSFVTDPLVEKFYNGTHPERTEKDNENFRNNFIYGAADSLSVAARVYLGISLIDILARATNSVLPLQSNLEGNAFSVTLYIWAALTFSTVKRTLFLQSVVGEKLGRVVLFDRLIDFCVALVTLANILNVLDIDAGTGLQSFFAAGGIGALVVGLASRGLAENIVGGFVLAAWDAFEVGDCVILGDGTEGVIRQIGLVETVIDGYDGIGIRIPNGQLNQRVSNLSRIKRSQVKQMLRFQYNDLDKIEFVLHDIKEEIKASCPKLIKDGSKPFQALLSQYNADHIQVVVNCHFEIPIATLEYAENKQEVLLAIARATKKNGVEFAIPSIKYEQGKP